MRRTIQKHPIAFLHTLGWLVTGLSMGYIMFYENTSYYDVPFADGALILFAIGCLLIVLTPLIGLIVKLIRKPLPSVKRERNFLRSAAKWYESTRPGFGWYYLWALLAALLPFLTLFSVMVVDVYVASLLLIAIGVSIWLCFLCHEWPESRLLKVTDTADRFHVQTGVSGSLLDDLYRRGNVLGIPKRLWEGRRGYVYNMLLQEGLIDQRNIITAHGFSTAKVAEHFHIDNDQLAAEDALWIPFHQFSIPPQSKGMAAIGKLFPYRLRTLADSRYESNRSLHSQDYPHASTSLRLVPDETATFCLKGNQLHLLAATATDPAWDDYQLYQGCMLKLTGAALHSVKWDHFETWAQDRDLTDDYLVVQEAETFYRALLEDAFDYEICSFAYHEQEAKLAVEIWAESKPGTAAHQQPLPFPLDDGLGFLLILTYDQLKWHWMNITEGEESY